MGIHRALLTTPGTRFRASQMMPWLPALVVTLFALLTNHSAHAFAAATVNADLYPSLDAAMRADDWQPRENLSRQSFVGQPQWIRLQLPAAQPSGTVLCIDNPWLRRFDVYFTTGDDLLHQEASGNMVAPGPQAIRASQFTLAIPAGTTSIYIYDHAVSTSNFPVEIKAFAEFHEQNGRLDLFHGLYYGVLLIMMIYNAAVFLGTRDRAYGFYVLYSASLIVFLAAADGTGAMLLWGDIPGVHAPLSTLSWVAVLISLGQLANHFMELDRTLPIGARAVRASQALGVIIVALIQITDSTWTFVLQTVFSIAFMILLMAIATARALSKAQSGRLFLVANGMFTLGGLIVAASLLGYVDVTIMSRHALHAGSLLELSIFSFALFTRLRAADQARWQAFEQSLELRRRNKELRTATVLAEEHRQLQRSLQQAHKLKSIGQMAGGFAHDFNNILASILGFTELAQERIHQPDRHRVQGYLEEIQRSTDRGAQLVKQLLLYSRNQPSTAEPVDLNEGLESAYELLRASLPSSIRLEKQFPTTPLTVRVNPDQLQQVLANLCINAAEAMSNRGTINLNVEECQLTNLYCTSCCAHVSGEYIAIKVEDNGPGIIGNAERLFAPFNTSKEVGQGTGLGLSVVHGIVHEHGGHVHASNRIDGGARFVVYLPLSMPETRRSDGNKKILLIEHDPSVARYLSELFSDEEWQIALASQSTDALEQFVKNPENFDLVVTNQQLPQGTGLELASDIHTLRPDLPILLTSGNTNDFATADLNLAGISAVFEKPLNSDQLVAKIRALLAVPQTPTH
ncbi:MAG: 7TM diverse intracellular signaling domain-containing protein [Pseudomonadota bacterium]